MPLPIKMRGIIIRNKVKSYAQKQGLIDFLAILVFALATTLTATIVALFLLKSPLYGLIGIIPVFFYRPASLILRAQQLDKKIGFNGELVSCLQLSFISEDTKENYSRELIEAFINVVSNRLKNFEISNYLSFASLNRALRFFLLSLILFLLYPAFFPEKFWFSLKPEIHYLTYPDSGNFKKGTEINLKLFLSGVYLPGRVDLIYEIEEIKQGEKLGVKNGTAEKKIILNQPLTYYFQFMGFNTKKTKLFVTEPLFLKSLEFHLKYPDYLKLKEDIKTGRQISAPVGTRVLIKGKASQRLNSVKLVYLDTLSLSFKEEEFYGEFIINKSDDAILHLKGSSELKEIITIHSIPDLPPMVEIFYPGYNITLPKDMKLPVGIKYSDDYGIKDLAFNYQFKENRKINLKFNKGTTEDTIYFDWDLSKLNMLPGDEITYYVQVVDVLNQTTKSRVYSIYFPTMEEIYDEVSGKESEIIADLTSIQENYRKNVEEIKRAEEKLMKERELSFLDKERLKDIIKKEEKLLEKINEWQEELKKTIENLKEGIILDQKSIEKLQELMKIIEELAPEELKRALENLKMELEKRPEEIKKAIEDLKELQEEFTRTLERTLEILKRFRQEEKLCELSERARELANETNQLDKLFENNPNKDMAGPLDSLAQRIDSLAQEIENLAQEEGLEVEASNKLHKVAQASKMCKPNNPQDLSKTEEDLNKIADDLQQLYESLTKGRAANLRKNMIETLNRLIEISKLEEEILKGKNGAFDLQSELVRATKEVAESLYAQQVKSLYVTPQMGKRLTKAIKEMEQALNESQGDIPKQSNVREAMRQLNLCSLEILENLKRAAEKGGSSTGMDQFLKSLSDITQAQMSLNQSMLSIFPIPVTGLTSEQKRQLARLAGKQRELRQALEALKEQPGAGRYQELLDNLGEEMKEIEEALYQYKLDRKLIERQKLLISRLLDAQKSIRQADWTKERKSRPGKDIIRPSPPPLPEELGRDELQEIIQRALKESYPKEYEIYIREYFQTLMNEEK